MGAVVDDVLTSFSDDAAFEGLTLHKRIEKNVSIMGDELLLTQLVRNLTLNAVQHNIADGQIWVSLEESSDEGGPETASLNIESTGTDLREMDLDDLFTPFNKGQSSRIMEHDGSSQSVANHGLGLSIAKEIVALHGGSIRLQARGGGGLLVSVNIPISR